MIFAFLFIVTVISTVLGLSYLSDESPDFPPIEAAAGGVAIAYVYLVARTLVAVRDIRDRNTIPSEDEVWPVVATPESGPADDAP